MGMWSRPSKRVPEVGQVGLFSPTSPRHFFNSNTSTVSVEGEVAAASSAGSASALPPGPGPDGDLEMGKEGGSGSSIAGESCLSPAVAAARPQGVSSTAVMEGSPVAPSPGSFSAVSAGEGVEALLLVSVDRGSRPPAPTVSSKPCTHVLQHKLAAGWQFVCCGVEKRRAKTKRVYSSPGK